MSRKIENVKTIGPIPINWTKFGSKNEQNKESSSSKSLSMRNFQFLEIYRFVDAFDVILLVIGTIGSFASGGCFPLLLLVYEQVTDALINYGKLQNIATMESPNLSTTSCENGGFHVPNNTLTPIQAIDDVVKWYVLLGFLSILFYTVAFSSYMLSAERQVRRIRYRLFHNILYQDIAYFDTLQDSGKLTTMLNDELLKVKEGIGDKVADLLSLVARMLGCLVFSLFKGWKLTLVIMSFSPLAILAFNLTVQFTMKYAQQQANAYAKANTIAQDVFTAIRTVTAFNGQNQEYQRYENALSDLPSIGMKKGIVRGLCQMFSNVSMGLVFTAALIYGQYLIRSECQSYSAGTLVVIFIACLNTTWCLNQIVPSLEKIANATASATFVFDTMNRKSKIDASKTDEGLRPTVFNGEIQLENITFNYPSRSEQTVLQHVNITIPKGKRVAFVGHSGCGKSTTLSLISRIYDPSDGKILFDGQDIRQLNIEWIRSQIGYVGQEPCLFSGSIEDNIRLGKSNATDAEIQKAAKIANAHDFILKKAQGYKSSAQGRLAGGEKQRIAIARAIIADPKLLLLDEATSALDNQNEKMVQQAINEASQGRTTIIVAHRLSTIRDADLIFVFDKGTIVQQGTHDELMQIQDGIYRSLAVNQNIDQEINQATESSVSQESTVEMDEIVPSTEFQQICIDQDEKDAESESLSSSVFLKILRLNSSEKFILIVGSLCCFLFGGVEPAVALLYSNVYGLLASPNLEDQSSRTRSFSLGILGVYVLAGILQCLSSITFTKAGEALTRRVRLSTFRTILRNEIGWFDNEKNNVASLLSRLSRDASLLQVISQMLIVLFSSAGALIFALSIAFKAGWKLTLVVLCFTPLLVLSGYLQGRSQSKAARSKTAKSLAEQAGKYALEAIQNIRTIANLNQEKFFIQKYQQAFNMDFRQKLWKIPVQSLGNAIANSFLYFIHVTTFSYGAKLVQSGEMTFDQVFQVFIVINFASMSIGRSTSATADYNSAKAAAQRILSLMARRSMIDPFDQGGNKPMSVSGHIEFRNVTYTYPMRPQNVLDHVNVICYPEETTAFVGPSGSGKSTIMSLLLRFHDVDEGVIYLDGQDLRTLNIGWLRSMIGFVQQEPILFDRTIRENIQYGISDRQVSFQEIEEAARQANIHDEIIAFPEGYETMCGKVGHTKLSGGQKQRIAIARALLRKPKLLLLDEATSALDSNSEKIVQTTIDNIRMNRTCLTIAHRLSTIVDSHKIVVIDHGRVREEGPHLLLMEKKGIYYKLHRATEQWNE